MSTPGCEPGGRSRSWPTGSTPSPSTTRSRSWRRSRAAAAKDPDLFRALLKIMAVFACPDEVLAPPGVVQKVVELGANWRDEPSFAPTREELLAVVGG